MRIKIGVTLLGLSALFFAATGTRVEAKISISIAVPPTSFDTTDLDARDRLNRPLKSAAVQQQFQQLWNHSLREKLLYALTPLRQHMVKILHTNWDSFSGFFRRAVAATSALMKSWFVPKKDRHRLFWRSVKMPSQSVFRPSSVAAAGGSFSFLVSFIISSTRLLR